MIRSVHLSRLLAAAAVAALYCVMLGSAVLLGTGRAQAQGAAAPDAAPPISASAADQREAQNKTQAALHMLKEAADADEQAERAKRSSETMPLATEFDNATHAMREHLKKMRKLAIDYHLSEAPAETKALRGQWIQMLETGRKLHQRMIETAMEEYRANPKTDSKIAEFLFHIAARNADADRFDGMLEVVQLLKETGFTDPSFDLCFGLTAGAHNEFEAARPHLQIAIKNVEQGAKELAKRSDVPDDQREATLKDMADTHSLLSELSDVESYKPLWEAEQKAREADANGEPLPRVRIETTKGAFEVELFENQAPNTVANFISLCEQNFYDGLPFHRVLTHFMAQGGCPNRDGSGGPGYTIRTELGEDHRNFFRGTLGMAMSAQPDSGGSQFFVCYMPRAYLNGKYVAFGRVVEGMNVLSDITHVDPENKAKSGHSAPDEIIGTKVIRKRNHPYTPEKMTRPPQTAAAQ